jgi:hypothetical protein
VLRQLADEGKDLSLQLTGLSDDDPYLAEATAEAREVLGDRVPMLVGLVGAIGRAADWAPQRARRELTHLPLAPVADPCGLAAWPIVAFDGTVVACCNQRAIDQGAAAPAHLRIGHATDGWPQIRARSLGSPVLRVVRTLGPTVAAHEGGAPRTGDYCSTCAGLSAPAPAAWAEARVARPGFGPFEREVQRIQGDSGPVGFARRYGSTRYADLVSLGYRREDELCAG